ELYGNVVSQWGRYNGHVAAIIAGAETQERYGTGRRFEPVPPQRQREAMRFLAANAFRVPAWFVNDEILFRIEAEGHVDRIRQAQAGVLGTLLNEFRIRRLSEYEALLPAGQAYTVGDMMNHLPTGVWSELSQNRVHIDVYRRNPQRPRYPSDTRAAARGELVTLRQQANAALGRAANSMTRLHLRDVVMEIDRILEPRS